MRREEKKKQDDFLEKVYKEKMKENEGTDDDMDWDPIEDELEDGRGDFIGMLFFTFQILCAQIDAQTLIYMLNETN